ncbi:hypothetical protein OHA21_13970 [Actinoplanes sp. NBC_00393]|uniref:hypothetical protein n=1 Tax=Actinoplanes sp. NBC_00393 TaxID=2975953 RepID=UPI002E1E35AA
MLPVAVTGRRTWPADPDEVRDILRDQLGPAWLVTYTGSTGRFRAERDHASGHTTVEAADPDAVCAVVDAYFDRE